MSTIQAWTSICVKHAGRSVQPFMLLISFLLPCCIWPQIRVCCTKMCKDYRLAISLPRSLSGFQAIFITVFCFLPSNCTLAHAGISNKFTAKLACAVCAQCRCRIQGFCVWDLILPSDVKQTNQAVHKELVELPGVSGVDVENADTSGLLWWGSYLFIRCEADRRGSS